MFKDPLLAALLALATGFLVVNPLGRLTDSQNRLRMSLVGLYNRALIQKSLNEGMKKHYIKQWKDMMQPKVNKMKVYRLYLITNLSALVCLLYALKLAEVGMLVLRGLSRASMPIPMFLKMVLNIFEAVSQDFAIFLVRLVQELFVLKIAGVILQSFSDYRSFVAGNKRVWLVKALCYATLANLRTMLSFPRMCSFGLVYKLGLVCVGGAFLLRRGNYKHGWLVNRLNYMVNSVV